jgi:hypothetical protein
MGFSSRLGDKAQCSTRSPRQRNALNGCAITDDWLRELFSATLDLRETEASRRLKRSLPVSRRATRQVER